MYEDEKKVPPNYRPLDWAPKTLREAETGLEVGVATMDEVCNLHVHVYTHALVSFIPQEQYVRVSLVIHGLEEETLCSFVVRQEPEEKPVDIRWVFHDRKLVISQSPAYFWKGKTKYYDRYGHEIQFVATQGKVPWEPLYWCGRVNNFTFNLNPTPRTPRLSNRAGGQRARFL